MYGMLCVLLATGMWLILASYWELPVSTTHSTVGGIIGMTMAAYGPSAVNWAEPSTTFPYVKGVAAVVASWIISPVLSGILSAFLFWLTRLTVLRSDNSYNRSFVAFPVLVFFTVLVNTFFILFKGAEGKINRNGEDVSSQPNLAHIRAAAADVLPFQPPPLLHLPGPCRLSSSRGRFSSPSGQGAAALSSSACS